MELCDADANGAEVAQYVVYLAEPGKRLMLCDHHMSESWPAMEQAGGIVAMRLDAIDDTAYAILDFAGNAAWGESEPWSALDAMSDELNEWYQIKQEQGEFQFPMTPMKRPEADDN